jgi:hypothetical protein
LCFVDSIQEIHCSMTPRGLSSAKESWADWTANGFAMIDDIHTSGPRLEIKAKRQLIVWNGKFQIRAAEQPTANKKGTMPVLLEITVDFGNDFLSAGTNRNRHVESLSNSAR